MMARNSVLARLACSASSTACLSCSAVSSNSSVSACASSVCASNSTVCAWSCSLRYLSSVFRRSEIARHFGESDQLTARVAKRANYDVRPEPRPALPQPPSLVLEASFARSDVELHRWFAILDVDFGVERREMASNDLLGLV